MPISALDGVTIRLWQRLITHKKKKIFRVLKNTIDFTGNKAIKCRNFNKWQFLELSTAVMLQKNR